MATTRSGLAGERKREGALAGADLEEAVVRRGGDDREERSTDSGRRKCWPRRRGMDPEGSTVDRVEAGLVA